MYKRQLFYLYELPPAVEDRKKLSQTLKSKGLVKNFVLAVTNENANKFLAIAKELQMLNTFRHWLLINNELAPFTCNDCDASQVIVLGHKINSQAKLDAVKNAVGQPMWASAGYKKVGDNRLCFFIANIIRLG